MNNIEKYNQILEESYKNYKSYMGENFMETRWSKTFINEDGRSMSGRPYTQEEFIDKIKTDEDFSKRWDLKIEKRELTISERIELASEKYGDIFEILDFGIPAKVDHNEIDELYPVARKITTLTYKNEITKFYGI
jgi:hypothetical protein